MSNTTNELEEKADRAAFEHTVYMALADLHSQLHPDADIAEFLKQLLDNKEAEKNRILNRFIRQED